MTTEELVAFICLLILMVVGLGISGWKILYSGTAGAFEKHLSDSRCPKPWKSVILIITGSILICGAFWTMDQLITFEPPPPIKLIMLDIDGVLNHNKAPKRLNVSHLYDPECVDRLNKLIEEHNAKLVVCSAWRIGQTIESMQATLDSIGVKGKVIGLTPWFRGYHTRDDEITAWLQEYSSLSSVAGFVLLDDDSSERFADYQVKPSWDKSGMTNEHYHQASVILSRKMPDKFDIGKVSICKSKASSETSFGGHHIQKKPSTTSNPSSKS
jgi:hypothetical protein